MTLRVPIPNLIPNGDRAAPDPEEQRWITSETVLALPSVTVKVELIDGACSKCVENKPPLWRELTIRAFADYQT